MKKIWKIQSFDDLYMCAKANRETIEKALEQKEKYYKHYREIPKKNGVRKICVVNKSCELYKIQANLKRNFFDNVMLSDRAYGFAKKRRYIEFLVEHSSIDENQYFIRLDIQDFFSSIDSISLRRALDYLIDAGEDSDEIENILVDIILNNDRLEQGTPIAPVISNIIFRPLDIRFERYCDKLHITYSRYADDLLFSSNRNIIHSSKFIRMVRGMLSDYGFTINASKIRKSKSELSINGFVTGRGFRVSRKKLRKITAVLFFLGGHKYRDVASWYQKYNIALKEYGIVVANKNDLINYLAGSRSFFIDAIRYVKNEKDIKRLNKIIERIEAQIDYIEAVVKS